MVDGGSVKIKIEKKEKGRNISVSTYYMLD